ncbi:hypothetical protein M9H77_27143 [Catharanthus roseus]|uniref:Uncharacterized protein n=1 Tax=Catharanthus roseus TaxID=4058 RepID=A0ACC0AD92_CATRO|nr:hypothetical protein M9H77_27143 [Catharanthus roseus]
MAGNKQKKSSSGSSFSFFGMFKSKNSSSRNRRVEYETKDDFMKAYKVWPSDEDRGRWVAEPGIDKKASAYITTITEKYWKSVEVAN